VVDSASDVVTEALSAGADTVSASLDWTLGSNVENLILTGTAINGTGNTLNNVLTGNASANSLVGDAGNDTLNGGVGNDTLTGGLGDDTYVVDSASDVVVEASGEGTDTVQSSVSLTLGSDLEKLTLTGVAAINATGNSLNNTLTGNSAANVLDGGTGNDTMIGGLGNDSYFVDSITDVVTESSSLTTEIDSVTSSVNLTLGTYVENLTLTGAATSGTGNTSANVLTGNANANTLVGNAGNDTLDGGTGADTLTGGTGDDTYVVDNASDVVTENSLEGTDTVSSSLTYTLGANLEKLVLTGASAINGTGNTLANTLTGNSAANRLDGGVGLDTMAGGLGDDTYVVDHASDVTTEAASAGTDTVESSVTRILGTNLENLTLTGATAINGTGNTLNNVLTGNSAANTLTGGTGNDTMVGGAGNDIYVVDAGDVVTETASAGTDTVQSALTYTLGSELENLTLTGAAAINGTGNTLNNVLTGNAAANTLNGSTGNDTMVGGGGSDIYIVDSSLDIVTEAAVVGTDSVQSSATFTLSANVENLTLTGASAINGTGNTTANILTGNSAANVLNGGAGVDTMVGGLGNDTYVIDSLSDVITENASEGTDTVQSSLTYILSNANLENLTLIGTAAINGTGNAGNNVLTGNSAANTLTGGTGNDTMIGGTGNDIYNVDSALDVVTETSVLSTEIDLVSSSVNWTLGANLERLTLTGTALNGTGNAAANTITGNASNNVLNGGLGIDTLVGGLGNDTYVVDNTADVVTEAASAGTDAVQSAATYTLSSNVENLTLSGAAAINGTGNTLNNVLTGNAAANSLNGSTGADTMTGGFGNDTYFVDNALDVISETSTLSTETDTVSSSVSWTLGANLERLTLTGTATTGTGNTLNNVLTGNTAANTLNGGTGNDTLSGGAGNDTYVVDSTLDVISETSAVTTEIDTVQSSVSWTLGGNLENLTLTGAAATNGTGNGLNNTIIGNTAANVLTGGGGLDKLTGGTGADRFDFNAYSEMGLSTLRDVINDFKTVQLDKIDLSTLDANLVTTGDQAFTFIGSAAFSATDATGQVRFASGILYGSNDADAAAEFEIQLVGVTTLTGTDLIA